MHTEDAVDWYVAEDADFLAGFEIDGVTGAAGDYVRLNAALHELFYS